MNKVIHVLLGKANPKKMNGVNVVVDNLCKSLHSNNVCDVEVVGITKSSLTDPCKNRCYKIRLIKHNLLEITRLFFTLTDKESIFHIHSAFSPMLSFSTLLLLTRKIKIVVTPHGALTGHNIRNNIIKKLYFHCIEKTLLNKVNAIHVLGESEKKFLLENGVTTRIITIPNGVNIYNGLLEEKVAGIPSRFLYCGRLSSAHKGLDLLIPAFKKISENYNVKLVIVGDGPDREELINLAAGCDSIEFLGAKFDREKENEFIKADYFVHPSRWDGMPIAVLESLGYGTPVVISNETNLGEYVRNSNSGFIIDDISIQGVYEGLLKCIRIEHKDFIKQMVNARNVIESELSWEKISNRINSHIYERV